MNLQHINLNELTDVTFKNLTNDDDPDLDKVRIKGAVYNGVKLTRTQIKEINTHHQHIILTKLFEIQLN